MIERILSKTQRRTVLALHADQQRLIMELNECNAALDDLAETYRILHDLPEGKYHFQGDGNEVRIVKVEKPIQAAEGNEGVEGEKLVDDVVEVETEDTDAEEKTVD